jgi:hypothetical protein
MSYQYINDIDAKSDDDGKQMTPTPSLAVTAPTKANRLDAPSISCFQAGIRSVKCLGLEFPDSCEKCVSKSL